MAATIEDETAAGRAAADRLARGWSNRAWVPASPTTEWAAAAVERFREIMTEQPEMVRASMKGADKGASTLSPRPFQGLVECLQNADDLGAENLHVAYRGGTRPEMLIVHDGAPVTLSDVFAMLLPWLSTKDGDPDAAGRFGIGQRTLKALGGPIELHAPPFSFVMGDDGPDPCKPKPDIAGVYDAGGRDTMLAIPLVSSVTCESVIDAVCELDVDALIFLRSIRKLHFHQLDDPSQDLTFAVEVTPLEERQIDFGGDEAQVQIADVKVVAPTDGAATKWYRRYSTRRAVQAGEERSNKATAASTPIGICVPMYAARRMRLYDRMPLPIVTGLTIGLNAQFDPDAARSTLLPNMWNRNRFADLGQLVAWAALEAFKADTATAWFHVPLRAEVEQGEGWTATRERELVVAASQDVLGDRLEVRTGLGATALSDIAFEGEELEPLLTEEDVERLKPGRAALPRNGRDAAGRWRRVLDELDRCDVVRVRDALDIVDGDPGRSAHWYVAFAALAERQGVVTPFLARPSLLLAEGTTTASPSANHIWVLVKGCSPNTLAGRLGLARTLHPAYFEPDAPTSSFVSKLEKMGVLFDDRDAASDVFAILGRGHAMDEDGQGTIRLEDQDLVALRDAWAGLPRERHLDLGPKVGRRIELRATWYGPDGRRSSGWARPVDMYLPAAIDREMDSFAKAAARAPGLRWVDAKYGGLLKQEAGRSAIGAQRLLSAWGVAREPRLIRPKDEQVLWARDTTPCEPCRHENAHARSAPEHPGRWGEHPPS